MRKLILLIAFLLVGSFGVANNNSNIIVTYEQPIVSYSENIFKSCTIRWAVQVIDNGEQTYTEINEFHTDEYSCEEVYLMIAGMGWLVVALNS